MKKAPDFTLQNTDGNQVKLKDLTGEQNLVILFFPLAFSGVCTKELCAARDNMKIYESLNAKVIGISVDSFFTLKAFKESQNLNFLLLSDFNKEVSKKYDSLYKDFYGMKGVSKRSVFVINKEGNLVYEQILEDADQIPDFNKVQVVLAELD
ncbi:MAG: redoxin domain-containing protein [Gracilimonas sp.]|nr:redoxin domain-containing protein [Gracilimonas sp.]